jgi:hypothetical protein
MQAYRVSHVLPERRDEEQTRACPGFHHRPIEVEGLAFNLYLQWGQLRVRPFNDEIRKDLKLDRFTRCVGKHFTHELHRPLRDSSAASGLRIISPNRKEESTVTGWASR